MTHRKLYPPFPWFGGKRRVAKYIWPRFGEVNRYFEPFAGGLAVLLANPYKIPTWEHVNDINGHIVNVWRSLGRDVETVAKEASQMISEARVAAIKKRLDSVNLTPEQFEDLDYYDAELAGHWIYYTSRVISGRNTGFLACATRGAQRYSREYFTQLYERLRNVRVYNREWHEIITPTFLDLRRESAIFFDPPYLRLESLYDGHGRKNVARDVEKWCIENEHPKVKICLAGNVGDYPDLEARSDWSRVIWTRKKNKPEEILLFSPNCNRI